MLHATDHGRASMAPLLALATSLCCAAPSVAQAPRSPGPPQSPQSPQGATGAAVPTPDAYAQAIEAELSALELSPSCVRTAGRFECRYLGRSSMTERRFDVRATYHEQPRTVEIQVRRFLDAPISHPATAALLERLMALHWKLAAARFSWNPDTGEVRLGTTLHVDSNFDRRAFRSLVRAIDDLGPRYHAELLNLQRSLASPAQPAQ